MSDSPDPTNADLTVATNTPCADWLTALPDAINLCEAAAKAAYREAFDAEVSGETEVSIVLADDDMVQGLNRQYRNQDKPTNVLSFPQGEDGIAPDGEARMLGDVIVAFQTTQREAQDQGKTLSAHTSHLVVHGVLHVLGFDHESDAEADDMEALERTILATLKIADPYQTNASLADPGKP